MPRLTASQKQQLTFWQASLGDITMSNSPPQSIGKSALPALGLYYCNVCVYAKQRCSSKEQYQIQGHLYFCITQ